MRDFPLEPVTFTARQAAKITGMSEAQQRNHRRHGYLPKTNQGWSRFTPVELAELLVMQQLAGRGLSPAGAMPILKAMQSSPAAALVSYWARSTPGAINPHPDHVDELEDPDPPPAHTPRYFVFDGVDSKVVSSLDQTFEHTSDQVAAIVIDLKALGAQLVDRAGPLWMTVGADE